MHRFFLATTFFLLLSHAPIKAQNREAGMHRFIDSLMRQMTLDEKIGQLNLLDAGDVTTGLTVNQNIARKIREGRVGGVFNLRGVARIREVQRMAVQQSRLKIPLLFGMDVIHGFKTTFPIPLALSSTWDMALVELSARIAAIEATADGLCWTFSPMVDLSRDPRWGRVAEGSGEDPYLGAQVGAAMVRGYQGKDLSLSNTLLSCVKHFALYGAAEAGRDYNTTDMSRYRMYNEYFLPYEAAVKAGAGSVMASFNEVDGIPATGNRWLMTEVLRNQWGFDGFVVTDYSSINQMTNHGVGDTPTVAAMALQAGIDMDMVSEGFAKTLVASLKEGKVSIVQIDAACRRILIAKYKLGLFQDPYRYCDTTRVQKEIFTPAHRRLARQIAAESFVLLKNENNLLPLAKKGTIAVIGPLANNNVNMTGTWSVTADHEKAISVLQGLREVAGPNVRLLYAKGANLDDDSAFEARATIFGKPLGRDNRTAEELRNEALAIAAQSDVVLAVLGESAEMSGESASRANIDLPHTQRELLKALLQTGKPVVLVLFTGRPLTITWEQAHVPAILNVWFGGTEAGTAIADVIFGDVNPSGKLTSTWPQHVGQIPIFYNHKNTGRPAGPENWFRKFESNYLDVTNLPLYPFGYGLSYTQFHYDSLQLSQTQLKGDQVLEVAVRVTNTGKRAGKEVVQLYVRDVVGSVTRPVKELKGFQKISLAPGESQWVRFRITPDDLKFYNYQLQYDWEPGDFDIMVGPHSAQLQTKRVHWLK